MKLIAAHPTELVLIIFLELHSEELYMALQSFNQSNENLNKGPTSTVTAVRLTVMKISRIFTVLLAAHTLITN